MKCEGWTAAKFQDLSRSLPKVIITTPHPKTTFYIPKCSKFNADSFTLVCAPARTVCTRGAIDFARVSLLFASEKCCLTFPVLLVVLQYVRKKKHQRELVKALEDCLKKRRRLEDSSTVSSSTPGSSCSGEPSPTGLSPGEVDPAVQVPPELDLSQDRVVLLADPRSAEAKTLNKQSVLAARNSGLGRHGLEMCLRLVWIFDAKPYSENNDKKINK